MGYAERVADPDDPLRELLRAARRWQVPPSVFIRKRRVRSTEWDDDDTAYAMALEDYEGQCDDHGHFLPETTKLEHADAYRPKEHIRCYKCRMDALVAETVEKQYQGDTAGLIVPTSLDPEVVALNRLPVPPLPPELAGLSGADPAGFEPDTQGVSGPGRVGPLSADS